MAIGGTLTAGVRQRHGHAMSRIFPALVLSVTMTLPSLASADGEPGDQSWVKAVRGSGTYQKGLANVRGLVEDAYDKGALRGASHWEVVQEYYLELARMKGCERGKPHAEGPVKECRRVIQPEPELIGIDYREGMAEVEEAAEKTAHPEVVERIVVVLYDYGYLQGLKHGVRVHNEEIRLAQAYYRSCMERANDSGGESACAQGSKEWSDAVLTRIKKRIEAHGRAAAQKAKQ